MKINIGSNEIVHFIGVGGIGMSGLAQIMNNMGFTIQGSDLNRNKNTDRLIQKGIKVYFGHHQKNLNKSTIVIISSAIKKNNKELVAARLKKLPVFKRGEMLANIVALKKNIIVAGSHGKTTTTSLVANILVHAGLDPTVINGGIINSLNNTAQLGKGEWAVIESDESDGSFLKLPITYSILTNLDKEHLDFYGSFKNLKKSFCKFIEKTPSFGKSLICIDNSNLKSLIKKCKTNNFLTYGYSKKSNYQITNVKKNKYNLIIHESNLPKGKGFAPVQWQILKNKKNIPVCLIEAENKVDSGKIFEKIFFKLDGTELYDEIRKKQAKATFSIIKRFLKKFPKIFSKKQIGKSTFYRRRYPKDNLLNINKSIKENFNLLRIGNNELFPSHFHYRSIKYIIKIFKKN